VRKQVCEYSYKSHLISLVIQNIYFSARKRFATSNSDLLTDLRAFEECVKFQKENNSSSFRKFCEENFISWFTVRDVSSLRQDLFASLVSTGFVPSSLKSDSAALSLHGRRENLIKSVILGGLWPRIARVEMPKAIFDKIQAGTIQRDHEAKEYKVYEKDGGRVFLHPQSIMFGSLGSQKSPYFAYFSKSMTTKLFLRDATEVT